MCGFFVFCFVHLCSYNNNSGNKKNHIILIWWRKSECQKNETFLFHFFYSSKWEMRAQNAYTVWIILFPLSLWIIINKMYLGFSLYKKHTHTQRYVTEHKIASEKKNRAHQEFSIDHRHSAWHTQLHGSNSSFWTVIPDSPFCWMIICRLAIKVINTIILVIVVEIAIPMKESSCATSMTRSFCSLSISMSLFLRMICVFQSSNVDDVLFSS